MTHTPGRDSERPIETDAQRGYVFRASLGGESRAWESPAGGLNVQDRIDKATRGIRLRSGSAFDLGFIPESSPADETRKAA
jgi:hypothetical protein